MSAAEPVPGQPCPVCGLPDPAHDWDAHDARPATYPDPAGLRAAAPNMLARSSTRGKHAVRVLALHTTEGIMRAADLRAWASWPGSSHAAADDTGALLTPADGFVPYHLAAWTLRSGNPWSDNLELCALAEWTRADWLARPQLLEAAAQWLAERSVARGVPLVKLTPQQYRAGAAGVIHHHDHTVGYQDGTHWDVGTGFPWDVVLARARQLAAPAIPTPSQEDDDMISIAPGATAVIPIPPGATGVQFAVDEGEGGCNIRVAVGWELGKYHPLPGLDKVDGFTGWVHNGVHNRQALGRVDQTLTVTHRGKRHPLGVQVLR